MSKVRTRYLGQYVPENAERITAALDAAGIVWWHKQHHPFTRVFFAGDWGVRLFVDVDRHTEAAAIADRITAESDAQRRDSR
jgi:hypothetical protein